jgi:16S rRNA (cytosine967-C5)-methyltransferase
VEKSSRPGKAKVKKPKVSVARQASLKTIKQVLAGQSLSMVQGLTIDRLEDSRDRGLANEIVNGVLRWRWQLEYFISRLVAKPIKPKDAEVQLILMIALYELSECRTPDYAIINEAVELVRAAGKKWAASLVNAVLRNFTREKEVLLASIDQDAVRYSHPLWMMQKIKDDWPEHWPQIVEANNQRPAFWLRVNQRQDETAEYHQMLSENNLESEPSALADHALKLGHGLDVRTLPGFAEGAVSVQDVGAQLSAELLHVSEGQRVLDLCAAPGGKTCHILERYESLGRLLAVEVDAQRMLRVSENLQRLKLEAELKVADARAYQQWWDGVAFDRILIDAPCSASGVIRRHPDIKTLRRESDIAQLVTLQAEILSAAWQMLAVGGELLYVTCSVFRDENERQIAHFLEQNNDATEIPMLHDWGLPCRHGRQLLPGEQDADGFYFCRLQKQAKEK